jgi:hypothetical protein
MQWYWWIPIGVAVVVALWLLFRNRSAPYAATSTPAQPGVDIENDIETGTGPGGMPSSRRASHRALKGLAGDVPGEAPGVAGIDTNAGGRRAQHAADAGAAVGASDSAEVTTATRGGTRLSDRWDPIGRTEDREPLSDAELADIEATEAMRGPGGQGVAGPQPPDQVLGAPPGPPHGVVRDDNRDSPVPAVSDSTGGDADPTAGPASYDREGEIPDEPGTDAPPSTGGHQRG